MHTPPNRFNQKRPRHIMFPLKQPLISNRSTREYFNLFLNDLGNYEDKFLNT